MQLQQQLSQQQQELLQQLQVSNSHFNKAKTLKDRLPGNVNNMHNFFTIQLLHHQYLMHHGINLQQQFLGHKQKSQQLNGGKIQFHENYHLEFIFQAKVKVFKMWWIFIYFFHQKEKFQV